MPAEEAAGAAGHQEAFRQPGYAAEVSDFLQHRATPAEAQRFNR